MATKNRTLSVGPESETLWERATANARRAGVPLSTFVESALAAHLGGTEACEVRIHDGVKLVRRERFAGRWLTDPPGLPHIPEDQGAGGKYSKGWTIHIAETERGRFVVALCAFYRDIQLLDVYRDGGSEMHVFDTFEDACGAITNDGRLKNQDSVYVDNLVVAWPEALAQARKALAETAAQVRWNDI